MDLQVLILDYIFTERAGVIAFLATTIYFIFQQNKTLSTMDIVAQTKLSKDQAETIVRFHGSKV